MILIRFPKRYRPLPDGYTVYWDDDTEHYRWVYHLDADDEICGLINWSRHAARQSAFLHAKERTKGK